MATFVKFQPFVQDKNRGVHDFSANAFILALCANVNAPAVTNGVLSDLVEIAYTNLSSRAITTVSAAQTGGVFRWIVTDPTLSAAGGAVVAFRHIVIYNSSQVGDPLVGFYTHTQDISLADGESVDLDFDGVNGVFDDQ